MFKVSFKNVAFATCSTIEEAVTLALAVHRSSNVPHVVNILDCDDCVIINFFLNGE